MVLPRLAYGDGGSHARPSNQGLIVICPRALLACVIAAPLVIGAAWPGAHAWAEVIRVTAGEDAVQALAHAAPGDTLRLASGTFRGDLVIDLAGLTIEG